MFNILFFNCIVTHSIIALLSDLIVKNMSCTVLLVEGILGELMEKGVK